MLRHREQARRCNRTDIVITASQSTEKSAFVLASKEDFGLPQYSGVYHTAKHLLPALRPDEIASHSHFVLDTKQAGVADFPYMALLRRATLRYAVRGVLGDREILADHLQEDLMHAQCRATRHVQEKRRERLGDSLAYRRNDLIGHEVAEAVQHEDAQELDGEVVAPPLVCQLVLFPGDAGCARTCQRANHKLNEVVLTSL